MSLQRKAEGVITKIRIDLPMRRLIFHWIRKSSSLDHCDKVPALFMETKECRVVNLLRNNLATLRVGNLTSTHSLTFKILTQARLPKSYSERLKPRGKILWFNEEWRNTAVWKKEKLMAIESAGISYTIQRSK